MIKDFCQKEMVFDNESKNKPYHQYFPKYCVEFVVPNRDVVRPTRRSKKVWKKPKRRESS